MSALYQNIVLQRVRTPLHAGKPDIFDAEGKASNKICGDKVHIYFAATDKKIRHVSEGCAIMAASADLMAEAAAGKNPEEIKQISEKFNMVVTSGVEDTTLGPLNALATIAEFPSRIGCAILPWRALEEALQNV